MRRITLFTLLLIGANCFAFDILDAFKAMPDYLTPTLNPVLKSELINSYINGSDSVENRYAGKSKITLLDTDNHLLQIQTSDVGKIELKIFTPTPTDTLIGYINTICTPECTSVIKAFNFQWNELPLETIDYKGFMNTKDNDRIALFESWDIPQFIEYSFTDKNTVKAKFTTFFYLDDEQQKQMEPIIKKSLTLKIKSHESNSTKYSLDTF
ncbi:MAG: DUF3256 family protein [Paludibacteraceae bacterium]